MHSYGDSLVLNRSLPPQSVSADYGQLRKGAVVLTSLQSNLDTALRAIALESLVCVLISFLPCVCV